VSAPETAARFAAERAGSTLIDFAEVGLPCWYVLARCDVLAKKPISAIDEAVMRAISLGIAAPADLQLLLGLDETVFEATVVGLLSEAWVTGSPEEALALTQGGAEVLESAVEIVSEERVVPFYYDGLLRRPVAIEDAIDPQRARRQGIREVPPTPSRPPDVAELRSCRGELVRILRALRDGRDQESELLAIRGFDRRDRHYRPALAMLFLPGRSNSSPQLAIAIDGEQSIDHEAAFSTGGQLERLGLERALRSRRRGALPLRGPKVLREQRDAEAEMAARERTARAEAAFDGSGPDTAADDELRQARQELGRLSPRLVMPHEHQRLLEAAIDSARSRLLISGGALTGSHLDNRLLRKLRGALERKVMVKIAVREGPPSSRVALKYLIALAEDQPALQLGPEPLVDVESVLLSDSHFAVLGHYPWLGHLGDADRPLGDQRSLLTTDSEQIDAQWERLDGRTPPQPLPTKRRRRRRRSRQSD
jgi:hypothetical protein